MAKSFEDATPEELKQASKELNEATYEYDHRKGQFKPMANEVEERAKELYHATPKVILAWKILSEMDKIPYICRARADIDWFISHGYRKVKPAVVPENPNEPNKYMHDAEDFQEQGRHDGYNQALLDFQSLNNGLFTEDK